jgi:hypothetical protein
MNVDDTMAQAERLHKQGRAKEALVAVIRALVCKQDYWMYQAAVQYACAAHDEANARLYFPRTAAAFQPILEAECKQNNIALRGQPADRKAPAAGDSTSKAAAPAVADNTNKVAPAVASSTSKAAAPAGTATNKPAVADSTSKAAAPAVGATPSNAAAPAGGATAATTVRPAAACEAVDTEPLVQQAAKLYSDGDAKAALATILRALACKQDGRMFRFAVTYACVARDVATAKQYFTKVAEAFKPNLEQKCQQEGLDVRAP